MKKRGKRFFSTIAGKSHRVNNPTANRFEYNGGRRPRNADVAQGPGTSE